MGKYILLVLSILAPLGLHAQQISSMSLADCINYALEHNENVLNARIERDIAETTVKETLSQGLPQITANGGLSRNMIIPQVPFTNPITNEETRIAFQRNFNGLASVGMDQLIFDGSYFVGLQASRTYRQLAEKQQIRTEIDVIEGVSKAYYGVLVAEERYQLVQRNFARLDSLLHETQVLFENGFAEKIDVNRVKVQYNNLRNQLNQIIQLKEVSLNLLKFQMGMPIANVIEASDKLRELSLEKPNFLQNSIPYQNRIEYSQLETNMALAKLDLKNNQVKYLPKIDAFINYGGNMFTDNSSEIFKFNQVWIPNSAFGANIRIPIFDGFYKSALIQRNRLTINQLDNQFKLLENHIDFEINEKRLALQNSMERLEIERENMGLGEEVFKVARIKYQEGVGSNLEVIDAESTYKDAETNYFLALYDALIAKVELEKALGQLRK
jgi:outer membrane protein